ncbi:hypothetical protein N9529_00140 [Crocinitomicaceae bacterium]|nr:hypothetical protein [Crocinitomicaceae bacterium]MDC0099683.1 hypothetical protein [Crocinitomicaceae bacterium]MDC1385200.1 hypothetical protein [Crocinitomicaceae bacterium]|tara:strand:- start:11699 stop:12307 length:609 start_codon:yes stop_codon:yes gene_type:complete
MKGIIFFLFGFILFSCSLEVKDEDFEGEGSFHISKPEGWFDESGSVVKANDNMLKLSDKQLQNLTDKYTGMALVCVYTKYNSKKYDGMLPTVEVNVAANPYKNFESFKVGIERSAIEIKKTLKNYVYIQEPVEVKVDGVQSVYFLSIFDLKIDSVTTHSIKSWTYNIPKGDRFYQINFSDINGEFEPSDSLFEAILRSVKVN